MKYYIKTFGCQMNVSDSERIAGFLEMHKFKLAKDINQADLVIFNTCGVRQSAEDRVYGQIHNIRKQESGSRNQGVKKIIILTGCLANRKDVQRRLKNKIDLFCGIKDFPSKILSFLSRHPELDPKLKIRHPELDPKLKSRHPELDPQSSEGSTKKYNQQCHREDSSSGFSRPQNDGLYFNISPKYTNKHGAFVPIMTGCNNFCTYCVVPYARGREVSRPAEKILSEIKRLIKNGCKEIILLGQNVNSYKDTFLSPSPASGRGWLEEPGEGKNLKFINFSALLKKVNAISGNFWIFFISNHPKDFSDELIECSTKLKKVCEFIHLPIQAGDDKILEKMNRKYTAKQYLALVDKIKRAFKKHKPGKLYAITSDIIVGFPGETKKQFLESAKIMKQVNYDMVYFGQFSPRPGTIAYKMKDNVSKKEKERRENYLNEILKESSFKNNKIYLGNKFEVLITENKDNCYFGHTRTMKNVKIISQNKNLEGKIVKVKITKANTWNLEGKITK